MRKNDAFAPLNAQNKLVDEVDSWQKQQLKKKKFTTSKLALPVQVALFDYFESDHFFIYDDFKLTPIC